LRDKEILSKQIVTGYYKERFVSKVKLLRKIAPICITQTSFSILTIPPEGFLPVLHLISISRKKTTLSIAHYLNL